MPGTILAGPAARKYRRWWSGHTAAARGTGREHTRLGMEWVIHIGK
ncbi:MAG: hypothetical protein ABJB47_04660 [Actinomycetota bacterium]